MTTETTQAVGAPLERHVRPHAEAYAAGVAAERARLTADAETWGDALNAAGWEATEAYRRHTGQVEPAIFFNHAKSIVRDALAAYFKALGA